MLRTAISTWTISAAFDVTLDLGGEAVSGTGWDAILPGLLRDFIFHSV